MRNITEELSVVAIKITLYHLGCHMTFLYTTVKLQQKRNRLNELVWILGWKHQVVVMTMNHCCNCVLIRNDTAKLLTSLHRHSISLCLHAKS